MDLHSEHARSSIYGINPKETVMLSEVSSSSSHDDLELNAYNAAFYELGFRWFWDRETYRELFSRDALAAENIHHYLSTRQPHLLKADDAAFLVQVIAEKTAQYVARNSTSERACRHFDWAQAIGCEIGA